VNRATPSSLGYPLSVFNKKSTLNPRMWACAYVSSCSSFFFFLTSFSSLFLWSRLNPIFSLTNNSGEYASNQQTGRTNNRPKMSSSRFIQIEARSEFSKKRSFHRKWTPTDGKCRAAVPRNGRGRREGGDLWS